MYKHTDTPKHTTHTTHTHIYIYMCVCVCVNIDVCVCVCVCTCIGVWENNKLINLFRLFIRIVVIFFQFTPFHLRLYFILLLNIPCDN